MFYCSHNAGTKFYRISNVIKNTECGVRLCLMELWSVMGPLSVLWMTDDWVGRSGEVQNWRRNVTSSEKACPLLPTNLTWTAQGSNPSHCNETVTTNSLSCSIPLKECRMFLHFIPFLCHKIHTADLITNVKAMNLLVFTDFQNLLRNY
jgi:hypothetical protein